jgi:hypothetical protein
VDDFRPNRGINGAGVTPQPRQGTVFGGLPTRQPAPTRLPMPTREPMPTSPLLNTSPDTPKPVIAQPEHAYKLLPSKTPGNNSKKMKMMAIIAGVVFLAITGFAIYEYIQGQSLRKDNDQLTMKVKELEGTVYDINYKSKDNVLNIDVLTKKHTQLITIAKQLKTACGTACKDVVIQ